MLTDCGAKALVFEMEYDQTVAQMRGNLPELSHYISLGKSDLGDCDTLREPALIIEQ